MELHRLRALKDNYVYLLVAEGEATAIDPGEARPVDEAVARLGVKLVRLLATHHHLDHTGALEELARRHRVPEVVASRYDLDQRRVPAQTRGVVEDDVVELGGGRARVLFIPAHTLGHVAYLMAGEPAHLFCGDTLFGAGCGRLFEGTPADMVAALAKLRALPDDTWVECGHEYTLQNLRFAIGLDPDNVELRARLAAAEAEPDAWTVPLPLGVEKRTNPFLRWDAPALTAWAGTSDPVETFAKIRRAKDVWRG